MEEGIESFLAGAVVSTTGQQGDAKEEGEFRTRGKGGYEKGDPKDFDPALALDRAKFWNFLEKTQPEECKKLHHKPDWKRQVEERLHRKLKKDGLLAVLKRGLKVDDADFNLLYRLPYNNLNPEVQARFQSNVFSVSRQVAFCPDTHQTVDMVLFMNGLPTRVITKSGSRWRRIRNLKPPGRKRTAGAGGGGSADHRHQSHVSGNGSWTFTGFMRRTRNLKRR